MRTVELHSWQAPGSKRNFSNFRVKAFSEMSKLTAHNLIILIMPDSSICVYQADDTRWQFKRNTSEKLRSQQMISVPWSSRSNVRGNQPKYSSTQERCQKQCNAQSSADRTRPPKTYLCTQQQPLGSARRIKGATHGNDANSTDENGCKSCLLARRRVPREPKAVERRWGISKPRLSNWNA